ncbi:hypothetical protein ACLOJK_036081 [Asimina triloba]
MYGVGVVEAIDRIESTTQLQLDCWFLIQSSNFIEELGKKVAEQREILDVSAHVDRCNNGVSPCWNGRLDEWTDAIFPMSE